VLIDRFGSGISHAIGLGSRDLSNRVDGISALMALDALESDPSTRLVVVISKPPESTAGKKILERIKSYKKPVVVAFLGGDPELLEGVEHRASNLEEAARIAVGLTGMKIVAPKDADYGEAERFDFIARRIRATPANRSCLRGLYTGGSLADEAQLILGGILGKVRSNCTKNPDLLISGSDLSGGHSIIDMGDDEFTVGRPHPMIDPTLRAERLTKEWSDPSVAVILCDLVLGVGSHSSPATPLAEAVQQSRSRQGDLVTVVASVCGTERDPQILSSQERILRNAGVLVLPTNAQAARTAGKIAQSMAERGGV